MWWKIYFWISVIVAGFNVIGLVEQFLSGQVSGVLVIVASVVYALAVYSYAYNKHIFSQKAWQKWLVIVLIVHILRWSGLWPFNNIWDPVTLAIVIFGSILFPFPAWYCIYKLGFGKRERVKVSTAKTSKKKTIKKS